MTNNHRSKYCTIFPGLEKNWHWFYIWEREMLQLSHSKYKLFGLKYTTSFKQSEVGWSERHHGGRVLTYELCSCIIFLWPISWLRNALLILTVILNMTIINTEFLVWNNVCLWDEHFHINLFLSLVMPSVC